MRYLICMCLKLSGVTWTPQPRMSLLTVIPVHFRGEQEADMTRICTGTITCWEMLWWFNRLHFLTRLSSVDLGELFVNDIFAGIASCMGKVKAGS